MKMSLEHFIHARHRISTYLKSTPVLRCDQLEKILGYRGAIYLKLESEQPTGSFKVRGAFNVLLQTDPSVDKVVALSSGNFAQAVAYGAATLQKKATIVMPESVPHTKIEGTQKLGANIIFCGQKFEAGEAIVKELAEKEGYFVLHPYNNYQTIAGQGTIALEILDSNPQVAHFFCPVGGGGLLSGCGSVFKDSAPSVRVFAVEPLGASDFYESFYSKRHCAFEKTNTIADGLRAVTVGELNYPILMSTVDQALAISDDHIIEAMRLLWEHHHLMVEPSGATALAGFLSEHQGLEGDVMIVITGKNVDAELFDKWVGIRN